MSSAHSAIRRASGLAATTLGRLGLCGPGSPQQFMCSNVMSIHPEATEQVSRAMSTGGPHTDLSTSSASTPGWLTELRAANRRRDPARVQAALTRLDIPALQCLGESQRILALRNVILGSSIGADPELTEIALGLLEAESPPVMWSSYNQAVNAYTNAGSIRPAQALEFLRDRVPPKMVSIEHIDRVLQKAVNKGDRKSADACLGLLMQRGLQRGQGTYSALLMLEAISDNRDGQSKAEAIGRVWNQLLEEDKAQGTGLEGHLTHCARICALSRLSSVDTASQPGQLAGSIMVALQDFATWRLENPDGRDSPVAVDRLAKATYHALLALQRLGDSTNFAAAAKVAIDSGLKPDARTWDLVLKHYVSGLSGEAARDMIHQMSQTGATPVGDAYNHLLRAVAVQHGPQAALDDAEKASAAGIKLYATSYNQILAVLASSGSFLAAHEVYGTMRSRGVQPDQRTFHLLFKAASCFIKNRPRLHQSTTMAKSEGGSKGQWHSQALQAWSQGWKLATPLVHQVVDDMRKLRVPHSHITMETYLQALSKLNDWAGLLSALQDARESGYTVTPRTYQQVIRTLAANRKIKEARAVMAAMAEAGTPPTAVEYTCLISGPTCKENFATKVLRELKASGVVPDMRFYNKLISVYLRHGNVQTAMAALREAQEIGLQPEHHTFYTIAAQAARLGDEELLRWAVPRAQETYTNPEAAYVPPAEYEMLREPEHHE